MQKQLGVGLRVVLLYFVYGRLEHESEGRAGAQLRIHSDKPIQLLRDLHADTEPESMTPRVQLAVLSTLRPKERREHILHVTLTHPDSLVDHADLVHVGVVFLIADQ